MRRYTSDVLVVDSFTTRNIKDTCTGYLPDRVFDAYGALDFLSTYNLVDARRIALMGFSAGGIATLEATKAEGNEQFMDHKFKAAVAYYPICAPHEGDTAVPTLILNGELDDWSPAELCQQRVSHLSGKGPPIELDIYPGAYHDFDSPEFEVAKRTFGHREEYNAPAAEQSFNSVQTFLQKYLSD
jgi:dienelactone hydrolase